MARIQDAPQSTTYTKKADKKKTAKPVGARFTNKLAKRLGKKTTTKPSASEIEKFLGKGVYKEKRADKSDIKPKDKFAKGGQASPQSESYTARADKKKTAKPVGVRFTDKLAKRLGKKATTKPTLAEAEKYRGKGVYKENRKDKSDMNPKNRFAKGGKSEISHYKVGDEIFIDYDDAMNYCDEHKLPYSKIVKTKEYAKGGKTEQTYAQSPNYNEFRDIQKDAKPVGYRYTDALAKRLGVSPLSKPSKAHIDKYLDKGVYWENRADKSDQNRKDKLEDGGDTEMARGGKVSKSKILDLYKTKKSFSDSDNEKINDAIENGYLDTDDIKEDFMDFLHKKLKSDSLSFSDEEIYEFTDEQYENGKTHHENYTQFLRKKDGKYAKGGIAEHGLAEGDEIIIAKNNLLVVKNIYDGKHYLVDITKGTRTYQDSEREYAKGGQTKPIGYRYTTELAQRLGVNKNSRPTVAHIEKYLGNGIYYKKFEDGGDVEYAKGGQAPSYKETYFGNKWTKKADKEEKGKRVGYRYTDKLAKRLGVNKYAKPTDAHIEKYLGNGIYFENRKDKSDVSPKDKLAKGGKTEQTYAQSTNYNEFRDITKEAKPVGYRYTNALAKRLGVSPLSKPSKAHIDKYLDKGVYWENRADKSDQNRKDKLEDGGEMAKGGGTRISNSEASSYAENHQPFRGNNLEAKTLENGDYVVLSYGYYPIWYWNKKENKWYQNKDKFSQTTARHITASRPTYDAQVVSRNEMDNMMAKSLEGNGFMALGGELSSFVVTQ